MFLQFPDAPDYVRVPETASFWLELKGYDNGEMEPFYHYENKLWG